MNKTCSNSWGRAAAVVLVLLMAAAVTARTVTDPTRGRHPRLDAADPNAQRSLIVHDIGNVRMTLSNWGEGGNPDAVPGFKGFEYPINSGSDFLFSSGLWVGAIVNGVRQVSTCSDGDNGTAEFWPVHIGTVPFDRQARNSDWYVTSKNFDSFGGYSYAWGAKGIDDDGDWNPDTDDLDHNGKPSVNYDKGHGLIGYDDDGDGLIDEDSVAFVDGVWIDIDVDSDGNVSDTGPSGDANHDGNCSYDPEPHMDEDPAGDISHDYLDNDFDGLVDMDDPDYDGDMVVGSNDDDGDGLMDEDGVARGVQEYYCVMQDNIELTYVGNPETEGHTPLNILALQRTYAFPEAYASEFILLDYRIRNIGPLPLENVYIAMFSDPDIAAPGEGGDAASTDDGNYYDATRTMMIQYDDTTDNDGTAPGIFAIRVVKTPVPLDELRVSFANFERVAGGDPDGNANKYDMISSGAIARPTAQLGDWRMLIGFGAQATNGFRVNPGEELPITMAFIAGRDVAAGNRNAEWALAMYLNDFQGPSAPDVPEYVLDVYSDRVRIRWQSNAEASVDAITGLADFEGYVIERSLDQINWETVKSYDRIDTLQYPFEWQNFNLGMPEDQVWTRDPDTGDSTAWYYYEDMSLIPGHVYYYCVRAFDQGVLGAGVLYSGRTGNVREAVMARTAQTGAPTDLSGVYVFPNPYKGSHPGEEGGQINPSKGLLEYPRKLYFMGLPAERCEIRIYSLAGDHVATINHTNGTERDQWDMITRSRQEIVSGIYYYTVEYGSHHLIDKFVVIK